MDDFTLIIPTYNRPERLRRLLGFLSRERLEAQIYICDSSPPEPMSANREVVAQFGDLPIRFVELDPATQVWSKFAAASALVETPFCALCADDDFVLPSAVADIVARMKADADVALGHGWYFSFDEDGDVFEIRDMVYRGPSLTDPDPVRRMYGLATRYEALTYGVHRTPVMQKAFGRVRAMDTMLTKEVGSSMVAAILGRVERYPVLYHGRSAAPSLPYLGWHPLEMLAEHPEGLFATYGRYRRIVAATLAESTREYSRRDLLGLVDLAHIRYLHDTLRSDVLDHLFHHRVEATNKDSVMHDLWLLLIRSGSPKGLRGLIRGKIADSLARRGPLRLRETYHGQPARLIGSVTATGEARRYMLAERFLRQLRALTTQPDAATNLIATINNYAG